MKILKAHTHTHTLLFFPVWKWVTDYSLAKSLGEEKRH
jgi:hypothetical protein